jgi:hypothetical protein
MLPETRNNHNFVVTQSGMIPAQSHRTSPCQIVTGCRVPCFLERLKIELKMLTHQSDLHGSDS